MNRAAKAARVVAFVEDNPKLFGPLTIEDLANFPTQTWALINECMGEERPMSELTITTVIGMLFAKGLHPSIGS